MRSPLLLAFASAFFMTSAFAEETIGSNNAGTLRVTLNNTPWMLPDVTDSDKKVTPGPHAIPNAGVTITNNETNSTLLSIALNNDGCLKLNTSDPCNTDKAMKVTAVTLTDLGGEYNLNNAGATASKTIATVQNEDNTSGSVAFTFAQGTATLAAGAYSGTITITATSAN